MLQNLQTAVGLIAGLAGLFALWRASRDAALRKADVLAWSNAVIATMQSLVLLCRLPAATIDPTSYRARRLQILFDTSVLVEQGRLFFRNIQTDHGAEKESAYRGLRPVILDPILTAHLIACALDEADAEDRLRIRAVAEDSVKKFVSLAQKEVGRSRTIADDTRRSGDPVHLPTQLARIDPARLARLRATPA